VRETQTKYHYHFRTFVGVVAVIAKDAHKATSSSIASALALPSPTKQGAEQLFIPFDSS